jgi:prepilin-type N-terminal cleavage/methylation domain-containing protein
MKHRGLTFVEVLIGIVVIAIVAAIVIAVAGPIKKKSDLAICYSNMRKIHMALEVYRSQFGGAEKLVGDAASLGLPYSWLHRGTLNPIIGTWDEWKCPAPKHTGRETMPGYKYMVWPNEPGNPPYEEVTARYQGKTPILLDFNHNNHAVVNINSPIQPKRIMYLTLDGNIIDKHVKQGWIGTFHFNIFEID